MAWCGRNDTHKEGEKSHDDKLIEKKTEVSSSKTDKSNNKIDSDSTTGSKKNSRWPLTCWPSIFKNVQGRNWKRIAKGNLKIYISSSSESSDSDTSNSDSDDSDSNNSDSELKYRRRKKHRKDSCWKSRKRKQKWKSKHSKYNTPQKGNSSNNRSHGFT